MTGNTAANPQQVVCGSGCPDNLVDDDPFKSYCYSYPHKTAHRPLTPPVPLGRAWQHEDRSRLFLYFHVPFCPTRCGFCNLFTLAAPDADVVSQYIQQLRVQAAAVREALDGPGFARLAIGGGTPSLLGTGQLESLFDIAADALRVELPGIPTSCEISPATATREKLELLARRGVTRLSVGVQTFDGDEAARLGRRQSSAEALRVLEMTREIGFPTLNIDLIYGCPGQTTAEWLQSVQQAVQFCPEELYLYPLYVRPLTAIGRKGDRPSQHRITAYRESRRMLLATGYEQVSLRMFRRSDAPEVLGPAYCCQSDGMIGLGCGARSYTRRLHYGSEYAVGRSGVERILRDYLSVDTVRLSQARHGIWLDDEDQRRRFLILTLLSRGCQRQEYRARFGSDVVEDFSSLVRFAACGWLAISSEMVRLTPSGIEQSDTIGPLLFSEKVQHLMREYQCC